MFGKDLEFLARILVFGKDLDFWQGMRLSHYHSDKGHYVSIDRIVPLGRHRRAGRARPWAAALLKPLLRRLGMGNEFLHHPLWDMHPDTRILWVIGIVVVAGIWKMLEAQPLPGKLRRWGKQAIPAGECGLTVAQIDEASRDFARTFVAGGVMVMAAGSQRAAEPLASLGSSGAVNATDVTAIVDEFSALLTGRLASGSKAAALGAEALTRRLVGHLSVTPMLQMALYTKLPVSLNQPRYVVCISKGQVRIAMYAYVGAPVQGNRPDRKHTPFVLKVLTPDLLKGDDMPADLDDFEFEYTCRHTREVSIGSVIAGDAEQMCNAVNSDVWVGYGRSC